MAFLVVGAVTVKVSVNGGARIEQIEIGGRRRALDGTMLSSHRTRKKRWSFTTAPLTQAEAVTLESAIYGSIPVGCSGDIIGGTVNCHPQLTSWEPIGGTVPYRVSMSFELHEL